MAMLIQYANGVPAIKFSLEEVKTSIGRGLESDICVVDKYVSKNHAIIETRPSNSERHQNNYYIHDLDSTNHTYVNDMPVKQTRLKDKDIIRIGEEEFVFDCSTEQEQQAVAAVKTILGHEDTLERLNVTAEQTPERAPQPNSKFSRRLRLL